MGYLKNSKYVAYREAQPRSETSSNTRPPDRRISRVTITFRAAKVNWSHRDAFKLTEVVLNVWPSYLLNVGTCFLSFAADSVSSPNKF